MAIDGHAGLMAHVYQRDSLEEIEDKKADRSETYVESGEVDLFNATARTADDVMVMRRRAGRVADTSPAALDTVHARQCTDRDQQIERPEHGRAANSPAADLPRQLLGTERRVASQRCRNHARARARRPPARVAEARHDRRGRRSRAH